MVLISWFKEIKNRGLTDNQGFIPIVPDHLKKWLLDLLACSDPAFPTKDMLLPYAELSRTYTKMHNEASQLLRAVESSGFANASATTKIDLENLSADDAISFASKLSPLSNDAVENESTRRHVVEDIESCKQRVLTTSGYLKCVQVCIMLLSHILDIIIHMFSVCFIFSLEKLI